MLVERVEGFATEDEWRRAYSEISGFERSLVMEGTVLIKFWLHVSPDEQQQRFEARRLDALKSWKLTDEDWRNREKRAAYEAAIEEMLEHTDIPEAPWILVEGDSKRWARVRVMEETIAAIEAGMRRAGVDVPEPLQITPATAQRRERKRYASASRRTAISASRPIHTPRMPQSSASASSAIGT